MGAHEEYSFRAAEIFAEAIECPTSGREELVRAACEGDAALEQEVHTLLSALPKGELVFENSSLLNEMGSAARAVVRDPSQRSGQIVAHYELGERLGEGGMGVVYRAQDTALGRPAALKLLKSGVDAELRARLMREAQASARLEHPAVATFFESGSSNGVDFLAMEYVEGETLRSRLRRGALPPEEAIAMIASLLEAMVHSHAAGVVHRDIKPENIMLTRSGGVKLLDFGIAKDIGHEIVEQSDGKTVIIETALTVHGMIVGTIGYMSPEQLRGDPVSESTDVFALGAVLYEALTGELAFPGSTASQRIASVLSRQLPPVHVEGVHEDINTILQRAVARDPADRYPTATAFLMELRRFATGDAVVALPNTLAVLDLQNLSGNSEVDWLGSGVAESLGAALSRAEGMELVSRNAVLRAMGSPRGDGGAVDPVSLGLAVGCRWVLTGSFQHMGQALRLTMRLVEVSTGKDFWSENLDGKLDDIFEMQDRLAKLTAESLKLVLPHAEQENEGPELGAYEYYAKAQRLWRTLQRGQMAEAVANLERAVEIDPNFAPALAGLASSYAPFRWLQTGDPKDLEKAVEFAERAIAADPKWTEGHTWLGYARWRQGRIPEAVASLEEALRVAPDDGTAHYFLAHVMIEKGDWAGACDSFQNAARIEPNAPHIMNALGIALMRTDRLPAARWTLERAVALEKGSEGYAWAGAGVTLAECIARQGLLAEARECCLASLEKLEQDDHAGRGVFRALGLLRLGEIAADQADGEAARVAFEQTISLIRSQPEGPSKGHFLVQALAGLSRISGELTPFEEALEVYETKNGPSFVGTMAMDDVSLYALGRAAWALDRKEKAQELFERARKLGSLDAQRALARDMSE